METNFRKEHKLKKGQNTGITLIALVITIIVLLILAGVVIATLTGDNGILTNANKGATTNAMSAAEEQIKLAVEDAAMEAKMDETQGKGFYTVGDKTVPALAYRLDEKLSQAELNKIAGNTANLTLTGTSTEKSIKIVMIYKETEKKLLEVNKTTGTMKSIKGTAMATTKTVGAMEKATWDNIEEIAGVISDNYGAITKATEAVQVTTVNGIFEIAVGDTYTISDTAATPKSYTIRVIGFNHDKLANTSAYGGTNEYAGITFDFVTFLGSNQMNTTNTNTGGWKDSAMRTTLETYYNSLADKSKIKTVVKRYIATYNDANSVTTSNDNLWLLAAAEVFTNNGYAKISESTVYDSNDTQNRYEYYMLHSSNSDRVKNSSYWWLRSPYHNGDYDFCCVRGDGGSDYYGASNFHGVAPGFSI